MSTDDDKISPETGEGHNRSSQRGVDVNPDPVLDVSNEHHHAHVHHGSTAVPEKDQDLMFAESTEKYTGDPAAPGYTVRKMSCNGDEESGQTGEIRSENDKGGRGKWTLKRIYANYKIFFHLAIWAVWTA